MFAIIVTVASVSTVAAFIVGFYLGTRYTMHHMLNDSFNME